jgi:hypothetical protein
VDVNSNNGIFNTKIMRGNIEHNNNGDSFDKYRYAVSDSPGTHYMDLLPRKKPVMETKILWVILTIVGAPFYIWITNETWGTWKGNLLFGIALLGGVGRLIRSCLKWYHVSFLERMDREDRLKKRI